MSPPHPWAGSMIDPTVTLVEVCRWPSNAGSSVSRRAASLVPSSSLGWSIIDPSVTLAEVSGCPSSYGSSVPVSRRVASLVPSSSLGWVNYGPMGYLSGSKRMAEQRWILCTSIQESGEPCPLLLSGLAQLSTHRLRTLAEVSGWPSCAGSCVFRRAASLVPSSSLGWVNYPPIGYLSGSKQMAK